jgi:hypothetical protein
MVIGASGGAGTFSRTTGPSWELIDSADAATTGLTTGDVDCVRRLVSGAARRGRSLSSACVRIRNVDRSGIRSSGASARAKLVAAMRKQESIWDMRRIDE